MPNNTLDLWGDNFGQSRMASPPADLLAAQAEILTRRTQGLIEGVVRTAAEQGTVWSSLYAQVPRLQGYTYKILTMAHSIASDPSNPFPLTVINTVTAIKKPKMSRAEKKVNNMDEFESWLRDTLSSEEVHQVINNLMWHSRTSQSE